MPRLYDGKDLRRSYVIWQEGKSPYVAIEFLSPGTEVEDLGRFYNETSRVVNAESATPTGNLIENALESAVTKSPTKLEVYERYLRIPHYLVYSRYTQRLRYFKLDGGQYQEQSLSLENPIAWLADLEIGLGIWEGRFEDVPGYWLRWCDDAGNWFLTDTEQARVAREQAEAQLLQAARNLLATGMEIVQVATILGLSEAQVQALESSH